MHDLADFFEAVTIRDFRWVELLVKALKQRTPTSNPKPLEAEGIYADQL